MAHANPTDSEIAQLLTDATTIAMVGGMLPSALGTGSGGEFRAPMAVAVIGGLISSTVLSLVFVPAVFVVMDDIGSFIWRLFGRFVPHRRTFDYRGVDYGQIR